MDAKQRATYLPKSLYGGAALLVVALFVVFSASIALSSPHNIKIDGWTATTPLPQALANNNAVVRGEYLFFVGGKNAADAPVAAIQVARIENNGALSGWSSAGQLPVPLYLHAIAATDSTLYVIGGWDGTRTRAEIWQAPFTGEASVGNFVQVGAYPVAIDLHDVVIVQNRLYVLGGWTGRDPLNTVYYAEILPGALGPWVQVSALPHTLYRLSAATVNNRIYVVGGFDNSNARSTVYVANVRPDGSLDGWQETTPLPNPTFFHEAVVHDGQLLVLGGRDVITEWDGVYTAAIAANGFLGAWVPQPALPESLHRFSAVTVSRNGSDYVYVLGGLHGPDYRAEVYHSTYPEPPTPTPAPTVTPTPQPEALVDIILQNQPQRWIAPGEEVTYTISYENRGVAELTAVEIANVVPLHVELLPDTIQASASVAYTYTGTSPGSTIRWSVGSLAPAGAGQLRYRVRRSLPTPPAIPRILAIAAAGPTTAAPGAPITYTLWLTNNTAFPVTGLTLAARLPAGATYLMGGEGAPTNGQLTWTIPELGGDETLIRQIVVSTKQSLVFFDYYATSDEGPTVKGQKVILTTINGTDPLPPGDGLLITNRGATVVGQANRQQVFSDSNAVHNPSYNLHLPLVQQ